MTKDMTPPAKKDTKTFSGFDKSFQEKIIQALIIDRVWAGQMAEVLQIDFFEYNHLKKIASCYFSYYRKYKEFPSIEMLAHIVADELRATQDSILKEQIRALLEKTETNPDLSDLGYVKDKSLDFCKRAGLQKALEESVDLIATEKYEKVVEVIKTAINAGNEHSAGLDLTDDIDARYSETFRRTIATGVPELDKREILNGGLGAGEIGVVVAMSGVGKSQCLVHFGATALLQGKNVLHYTYELSERATGIRYDSHLLGINSLDLFERREEVRQYYKENGENLGRLKIKYYPTGTATVNTIRSHIDKLAMENFRPDLIIIDYAGIMRSTERYELLRLELKKVFEELRGFAGEMDLPIWTAAQSNKEGGNAEVIDMTNMAEAYSQAHVADFILGLARKSMNKTSGYGNIFIAKNRNGIDGVKFDIHLDTSQSRLRVLNAEEVADMHDTFQALRDKSNLSSSEDMKNIMRMKLRTYLKTH
jgi:replicative DNA helicase